MADAVVAVLEGDGVGPEVVGAAVAVGRAVTTAAGLAVEFPTGLIGGAAIEASGSALPAETVQLCRSARAVLLGAVGGPRWSDPSAKVRPEQGLLALRSELGVYANLRPVCVNEELADASPLRADRLVGVDILFVRELTGGIYFGDRQRTEERAHDTCVYTREEIERVVRIACRLAADRKARLTSVDKANVLDTSRLWREVTTRVVRDEFPQITLEHLLVDAMAMHLLDRPADFDVVVTENMFGDILTDEASMLAGSLGLLPSASLGDGGVGLYEPIHGSAPDLAGKGIANPCGTILSMAMLLRHSLDRADLAEQVESAVSRTLAKGIRTPDLTAPGATSQSTQEVTEAVIAELGGGDRTT